MQKIMSIVSSVILISVGAHASPVIAGNDIPKRYHGLWQENNAEGHESCKIYKSGATLGPDDDFPLGVVGATIITAKLIHDVAEYGEGDFHHVEMVKEAKRNAIAVTAQTSLDGSEEYPGKTRMMLTFGPRNKLSITTAQDAGGSREVVYFRCADVPKKWIDRS